MILLKNKIPLLYLLLISVILASANPWRNYRLSYLETRPCQCMTTFEYSPVCASDGKTYANSGTLTCRNRCYHSNIYAVHGGECQRQPNFNPTRNSGPKPCTCSTTFEYSPVCGSNGKTYSNFGSLNCDNRCYSMNIYVAHSGECKQYEKLH